MQASRYSVQQGNFLEVICRNHFQGLFCFFVRGDSSCVVNCFVLVTSDLLKVSKIDMMTSGSVFRSQENKHLTISQIYWVKNYYNCIHSLHTQFYVKKYQILANLIFCCSKILYFSDIYHLESQKLHSYFSRYSKQVYAPSLLQQSALHFPCGATHLPDADFSVCT